MRVTIRDEIDNDAARRNATPSDSGSPIGESVCCSPSREFSLAFLTEQRDQDTLKGLVLLRNTHEEWSKNRLGAEHAFA